MIDPEHFKRLMSLISDRTPNAPGAEMLLIYYGFLNGRMNDEEFHQAAMAVWASEQFFPPPIRFLEMRAHREWGVLMELMTSFTPPNVSGGWQDGWQTLSHEARGAVVSLGGPLAFKELMNRDVSRALDAFEKAYGKVARDAAVVACANIDPPVGRPLLKPGDDSSR